MPKDFLDCFITQDESALFYECGYSCDHAWLLKSQEARFFITDSRYTLEAKECCHKGIEVVESSQILNKLCELILQSRLARVVFDSAIMSTQALSKLQESCKNTLFIPKPRFHQRLRIQKTPQEIAKIKHSQALNTQAYEKLAAFLQTIHDPINEKTLQFHAKIFLQDFGEYDLSFEPILAFNENAAKPHALPTYSILKQGDLILFDAGVKFERYCSDRTRTAEFNQNIHFQKEQKFKDFKRQKIYDIVRRAQEYVIENIRAGMKAKEVDRLAREVIQKAGYGDFFTHSTGHGIGLDIHEMPFISSRSEDLIEEGMVFSIEPGIYLPGEFGVRIEDLVVISHGRAQIL